MTDLFGEEIIEQKIIDREVLTKILVKELKGIKEDELIGMMYNKYDAIIDYSMLCSGAKEGQKISMLFNPHRYSTPTNNFGSIIDGFNNDSFLSGLSRATIFKHGKYKELLYQALQLGINGFQYVNEFPPFIARSLFIKMNSKKVLDPCAGWGGRMIGAASLGLYYHGFEPSTKTFNGLNKLGEFLKSFDNGFDFKIENIPFEESELKDNYDTALTSPPYYDTEIYSTEETNSCNRYKTYEDWKNLFYIPMIEKTIKHADKFIVNVGDRKYPLKTDMFKSFGKIEEIKSQLSGKSGLGKKETGKESFYIIKGENK